MTRAYKVYGNENTNLTLTEKAFNAYSNTDPLEIREFCRENEFSYDMAGCIEEHDLTADEVNGILEELANSEN